MTHAATAPHTIRNPGPFDVGAGVRGLFFALAFLGLIVLAIALKVDAKRAWAAFVQNHFYFLSLALGGLFFSAINVLTGAMWSTPVRRISESFTAYLPVAAIMFVILFFGMHNLYEWTHPEHVKGDIILEGKASYLNVGFFMVRNLIAFAIWWIFQRAIVGNSLAQDANGDVAYTTRNRALAPIFLIFFAITFTMAAFDLLMSLDPHWFSTMFGVYCFAGMLYSVFALTCVVAIYLKRKGALQGIVNENHLHDLGKYMFAFTVFWAYIGFSQFMLIWYANMPEETGYFLLRMGNGWFYVSLFLLLGKFVTPFVVLLPRDNKRNESILLGVGFFMMFAQWVDMLWLVQPEFSAAGPQIGWIELGVTLGFVGIFGFMVSRFMARNNIVAIKDPKLVEAVFHHHQ